MLVSARLALAALALSIGLFGASLAPSSADLPTRHVTTDSAGIRLVAIPAGEFQMGGDQPPERLIAAFPFALYGKQASYFSDEYPRHRVRITRRFYLGQYEITVERKLAGCREILEKCLES